MSDVLENCVRETLETLGFELVEMVTHKWKQSKILEVFVDCETGVTADDCARIHRTLWTKLEDMGPGSDASINGIEVSSPGVHRPLRTERDFKRNIGRQVQMIVERDSVVSIEGTIGSADSEAVTLVTPKGEQRVPYDSIRKAEIRIQWK